MTWQTLEMELSGVSPLLLHNGQTADPLNKYSKEMKKVSSKRNKTEADLIYLAKLEFMASVYLDKEGSIIIPSQLIEALFVNGAKRTKQGKQAQAGFLCFENPLLRFDGEDLGIEELWERDQNRFTMAVKVQRNKVMRTRFIAEEWSLNFTTQYNDDHFNASDISQIFETSGMNVGLGDWRPKYGRFISKVVQ